MPFKQIYRGSIQEVYNVDGTLLLNKSSGAPDLAQGLARLKTELAAVPDLAFEARQKIEAGIDAALIEAKGAKPDGTAIKARLDGAAETLKSATGIVEAGRKLTDAIIAAGKWAALFLT